MIKLKVCSFWRSSQLRQSQLISSKYNKVQTTEGTKVKIGRFSIWQLRCVILDNPKAFAYAQALCRRILNLPNS